MVVVAAVSAVVVVAVCFSAIEGSFFLRFLVGGSVALGKEEGSWGYQDWILQELYG